MNIKDLVEEAGLSPKRKGSHDGGEYGSGCVFCGEGNDRFSIWPHQREELSGEYCGGRFWCRRCGKSGNAINFLRDLYGLGYLEACDRLKFEPSIKISSDIPKRKRYEPPFADNPPNAWIEKATAFVGWCHEKLIRNSPGALAQVQSRGFTIEAVKRYKLGFNPGDNSGRDFFKERKDWGLMEVLKDDGILKKQWLPVGLTIPTLDVNDRALKVKVRRSAWKEQDDLPKYVELSGSKSCPSVYGDTSLNIGLVLESEFDALLVQQEAGDFLYCVALGGSTKKPDADTYALLKRTKNKIFLPDFDEAGLTAWEKWKKMFPSIKRILTPCEKSAGDYFIAGGDLRMWLLESIKEIERKRQQQAINSNDKEEKNERRNYRILSA